MARSLQCITLSFVTAATLWLGGCATRPSLYEMSLPARITAPRDVASVKLAEPVVPDLSLAWLMGPRALRVSLPAGTYVPLYENDRYVLYTCSYRCLATITNPVFEIGGLAQNRQDGSWHHWIHENGTGSQPGPIAIDDLMDDFPRLPGKVIIYVPPLEEFQPHFKQPVPVAPGDAAHRRDPSPIEH